MIKSSFAWAWAKAEAKVEAKLGFDPMNIAIPY